MLDFFKIDLGEGSTSLKQEDVAKILAPFLIGVLIGLCMGCCCCCCCKRSGKQETKTDDPANTPEVITPDERN